MRRANQKRVERVEDEGVVGAVERAFGIRREEIVFLGRSVYESGFDVLVEVESGLDVGAMKVEVSALSIPHSRCIILTSKATPTLHGPTTDFVSRVFAPNCGITEDPVTGSAHCTLAVHYGTKMSRFKGCGLERDGMKALQLSKRGGEVEVLWDRRTGRVQLWGTAVTVSEGRMFVEV
ncbi:hypothetical protein HDU67_009154 [Dinochytrium kinnereticum]|nr:hypothetical protein HDU67_009154 [Dinochytrium kinnereticum]